MRLYRVLVGVLLCVLSNVAAGETVQYTETVYSRVTRPGDELTLSNGKKAIKGGESYAVVVNDQTGEVAIEWCNATAFLDPGPNAVAFIASCTAFYENGDALLMWGEAKTDGKGEPHTRFTIMGGTGRFAGATGEGTTERIRTLGDGSWIGKATVSLTTK
jgi:hypothetical protein